MVPVLLSLLLLLQSQITLAVFSSMGCYPSSAFDGTGTSYEYQSVGYCENQCASYAYAALIGGNMCLCSNTSPSTDSTDSSNCDTACVGYGVEICGGDDYYVVYKSDSASSDTSNNSTVSSTVSSTSSSSSSSSVSSSSTSSDTSSSTSEVTSSSSVTKSRVSASTITSTSLSVNTQDGQTITSAVVVVTTASSSDVYVTLIQSAAAPSATAVTSTTGKSSNNKSSLSKGAIAGIVVGVVCAVLIFLAVLFFIWRQRKKNRDLEKSQNAAIAATVVANNYNQNSEKLKNGSFPNSRYGLDEESEPIIGSTGDEINSGVTPSASYFSRNNSSKHQRAASDVSFGAINTSGVAGATFPRRSLSGKYSTHSATPSGKNFTADNIQEDDELDFSANKSPELRIMNPDTSDEEVDSKKGSVVPGDDSSDDEDDELFADRVVS